MCLVIYIHVRWHQSWEGWVVWHDDMTVTCNVSHCHVTCHVSSSHTVTTLLSTLTPVTQNWFEVLTQTHFLLLTNVNWFLTDIGNSKTANTMFQSTLWLLEILQSRPVYMTGTITNDWGAVGHKLPVFLPIFIFLSLPSRDSGTMTTWFESSDIKICLYGHRTVMWGVTDNGPIKSNHLTGSRPLQQHVAQLWLYQLFGQIIRASIKLW